jgi:hypothetical protein
MAQYASNHILKRSEGHDAQGREASRPDWMGGFVMLEEFRLDAIHDCYCRAAEARRIADGASNPETKSDFLEFERRWLALVIGFKSDAELRGLVRGAR